MAKTFPSIFPYDLDSPEMKKLGIQTEYEVYNKLKDLSDDFQIFCGPKFLRKNSQGQIRDGEYSDFIIIHKQKGVLFLECKGGQITYNSEEVRWYQNGKQLKKSPLKQASDGKFALTGLLGSKFYRDKININEIPSIHGAIFPNTPKIKNISYGTDIQPEMILWANDYDDLEINILKLLELNKSGNEINEDTISLIQRILYGETLQSPFKEILKLGEHRQDLEFDQDQQSFLLSVFKNKKMIVEGLAGTGKTIIAAKIASHEDFKDKKVLILTKTKGLSQFLKMLARDRSNKDFRVYAIDQFVKKTAMRLNFPMAHLKKGASQDELDEYFNNYEPQICSQMFEKFPDQKFDLLIIDEAQDFDKNWFKPLNDIVSDSGQIFFFYDPLQTTIKNSISKILREPDKINFPVFNFNANYRNSSSISNFLQKLITNYFSEFNLSYSKHSKDNEGKQPELIEANSFDEIINQTIIKVKHLIENEKFKPRDIGVLGVDSMLPSKYGSFKSMTKELTKLGLKVINAWDYSLPYMDPNEENDISFSDIRSFKGLEKRIIILVNFKEINKENVEKIYTGLSRARGELIVITYGKAIKQLKELI
jgi:hypothetical protein